MFKDISFTVLLPNNRKNLKYEKNKSKNKSWIIKIGQAKIKEKHQKNDCWFGFK